MTEAQERALLAKIPTLACEGQITGFRQQISDQGDEMTTAIYAALIKQSDRVRGRK